MQSLNLKDSAIMVHSWFWSRSLDPEDPVAASGVEHGERVPDWDTG